jgi:hypothetical protein
MLDPYVPPGSPFIIRWQDRHQAIVEAADGSSIARLHLPPGGEPEVTLLAEPTTFEERARLCSALAWAVIEHTRGDRAP